MKVISSFFIFLGVILVVMWLSGCDKQIMETQDKTNLEFTVVSEERLPVELQEIVEIKKQEVFKMTYVDDGYLYICVGYGAQETGGYSIAVKELYLMESGVYVDTNLMGPKAGSTKLEGISYPYIVLKLKDQEKSVIFQ